MLQKKSECLVWLRIVPEEGDIKCSEVPRCDLYYFTQIRETLLMESSASFAAIARLNSRCNGVHVG